MTMLVHLIFGQSIQDPFLKRRKKLCNNLEVQGYLSNNGQQVYPSHHKDQQAKCLIYHFILFNQMCRQTWGGDKIHLVKVGKGLKYDS